MNADMPATASAPPDTCTVLCIGEAEGQVWVATDTGLWHGHGNEWRRLAAPGDPQIVSVVTCAGASEDSGAVVLAAGLGGGVLYSPDAGAHWFGSVVDDVASSVTCFAVSPRFAQDRVVLAGTEGDGVLRSTDGGRRWRLANFGLTGYAVLAIAAPSAWRRREEVFLATDESVYRSPNGGRAWQQTGVGLEAVVVQALATSPQFAVDQMLYAGSEGGGLYRSVDAGRSWQLRSLDLAGINCIWVAPDDPALIVIGTSDGAILRSADGGACWERVWFGADGVLALGGDKRFLYAGLFRAGMLVSLDCGRTWRRASELGGPVAPFAVGRNAY